MAKVSPYGLIIWRFQTYGAPDIDFDKFEDEEELKRFIVDDSLKVAKRDAERKGRRFTITSSMKQGHIDTIDKVGGYRDLQKQFSRIQKEKITIIEEAPARLRQPLKQLSKDEFRRWGEARKGGIDVPEYGEFPEFMKRALDVEAKRITLDIVGKEISYEDIAERSDVYLELSKGDKQRITNALKVIR